MTDEEKVVSLEKNIRQAIKDYARHTRQDDIMHAMCDRFVTRLAKDSVEAKRELRELFRQSPAWDEELDALVINGTRTHDPDPEVIHNLASEILDPARTFDNHDDVEKAKCFFAAKDTDAWMQDYINAIKALAPKAYAPGKKKSRIFKALCQHLGLADETAGSDFQRTFAKIADEMSAKRINFKLFVSLNPAHFLTMSNPKWDERGNTLTSCHSLNSTEYSYNSGCSGYARDKVSFIAFTVADPNNPETLNNRKTTRQVFMYKPGNGVLLQSRLYNTSGGTQGAQEESAVYRDLIQREISDLEDAANLWKTRKYVSEENRITISAGDDFGGYPDWVHEDFNAKISVRSDHADDYEEFPVGECGLCISCACETTHGVFCEDCTDSETCDCCGSPCSQTYEVLDRRGHAQYVCESCLDEYYTRCDECGSMCENDSMVYLDGMDLCPDCRDEYYDTCDECGEWYRTDNLIMAICRGGYTVRICQDCADNCYRPCKECGQLYYEDSLNEDDVCENCARVEDVNYGHA
jgi:hypothetical protein